jgi:hypothetical protein
MVFGPLVPVTFSAICLAIKVVQTCSGSGRRADTMQCLRLRFFNVVFLQSMSEKLNSDSDSSDTQTRCYSCVACAGCHSVPAAAWNRLKTAGGFLGDFLGLTCTSVNNSKPGNVAKHTGAILMTIMTMGIHHPIYRWQRTSERLEKRKKTVWRKGVDQDRCLQHLRTLLFIWSYFVILSVKFYGCHL